MSTQLALRFDEVPITRPAQQRYHAIAPCLAGRSSPPDIARQLDVSYATVTRWAVDGAGQTVDFLLTARRHQKAARRFLQRAIGSSGVPEKITIDKSRANEAAIESHSAESGTGIEVRRAKYLNNMVEPDHRAIKRVVRPTLGFKSFRAARRTLAGIELMHMIRKEHMMNCGKWEQTSAEQFYSLAP